MDLKKRSWAKAIFWRVIGIFLLGAITYLITRNWEQMTIITILFHGIRLVLYYYHERFWERVSWGRVKHPLSHLCMSDHLTADDYEEIRRWLEEKEYVKKPPEYQI